MKSFKVSDKKYQLRELTDYDIKQSHRFYNKVFSKLIKDPEMMTTSQMVDVLKKKGVWNDKKDAELKKLSESIEEMERKIEEGGIELSEAKEVAEKLTDNRQTLVNEYTALNSMLSYTVENCAELERQDYLLFRAIYCEDTGVRYCKDFDEFKQKMDDDPVIRAAYEKASPQVDTKEIMDELPEIKFLKDYGFINADYEFIADKEEEEQKKKKTKSKPFLKNGKPVEKAK